jgi:threonine/homoserine/homoserine lactone efflux protein
MTPEHALAFLGFAVVVAGTPGPSNTMLTATGANVGVVRGLPALLGVAAGMAVLMFVVAFGLGALILATPGLPIIIKWCGAAVLLWLAWQIGTAHGGGGTDQRSRPIGFLGAAAFQWINPKSWLACTSAAAAFLDPSRPSALLQAALLAVLFVLAALPCCFVWLAGGAVVQRVLRSERARRTFNLVMAALLAASVVLFFT